MVDKSTLLDPVRKRSCSEEIPIAQKCRPAHVGSATLFVATANLCLAVLGAGQLTLPYALSQLGLAGGVCGLVLFALLTGHSLHTLSIHAVHFTPSSLDCIDSYSELVVRVLGPLGEKLCTLVLAIYAWGGALAFLVILKGEINYVVVMRLGFTYVSGSFLLIVLAFSFIWPLSSLEDISGLKVTSPLGCTAAIFITVVVLLCTPWSGEAPVGVDSCSGPVGTNIELRGDLLWWPQSFVGVVAALPLLSFALNMSWAYVPILCTLKERTKPQRIPCLIGVASVIVLTNYLLLGVFGYATFCGATHPNILESLGESVQNSSWQGSLVLLARAALTVQLTLALPMRFLVARRSILGDKGGLVGRLTLSGALVAAAAGMAVLPLNLATVMGITSSICASMIIYILPAIIDLKTQLPGQLRKAVSALCLLIGVFVMVAGLLAIAWGVAAGS